MDRMSMPWMPPKVIFLLFFDEASNVLLFSCGYHLHVKAKVQPLCSEDCCTFDLQEKTGILKLVLENNNNNKKTNKHHHFNRTEMCAYARAMEICVRH